MNSETENKLKLLRPIMWDYDIDPNEIYDFITDKRRALYHFTKDMILIRIME